MGGWKGWNGHGRPASATSLHARLARGARGPYGSTAITLTQTLQDAPGGALSIRRRVDHFAASADAIAAGEVLGVGGLSRLLGDGHALVLQFHSATLLEKRQKARLSQRRDHHVGRQAEVRARDGLREAAPARVPGPQLHADALHTLHRSIAVDRHRLRQPMEFDAILLGQLILIAEGRHLAVAAPVENTDR